MLRVLLYYVVPFLLPFMAFFAYRMLVTRGQGLLDRTPWFVLIVLGAACVVASLVSLAFLTGERPGVYEPPRMEDGRIVPGRVVVPEEPQARNAD